MSLFALDFGRSDAESAGDIGHEVSTRMWVSLQLALPLFILQVIASTAFALLLVLFRHSRLDFWGVVLCVVMLSISQPVLHHRRPVPLLARAQAGADLGLRGGLDAVKFLVLPIGLSLLARLGSEARLYRAMFLEEIGKDYVRTARAKGLSEVGGAVPPRAAQRADPDHHQRRRYLPYVFLGSLVFESFFGIPGLGAYVIEAIAGQDFAIVRTMVFLGALLYIAVLHPRSTSPTPGPTRACGWPEERQDAQVRLPVDRCRDVADGLRHAGLRRAGAAPARTWRANWMKVFAMRAALSSAVVLVAVPGAHAARQRALPARLLPPARGQCGRPARPSTRAPVAARRCCCGPLVDRARPPTRAPLAYVGFTKESIERERQAVRACRAAPAVRRRAPERPRCAMAGRRARAPCTSGWPSGWVWRCCCRWRCWHACAGAAAHDGH